ncbi:hypothetical protein CYMTET_35209, partial [Cymbomonas tetramitiformis]
MKWPDSPPIFDPFDQYGEKNVQIHNVSPISEKMAIGGLSLSEQARRREFYGGGSPLSPQPGASPSSKVRGHDGIQSQKFAALLAMEGKGRRNKEAQELHRAMSTPKNASTPSPVPFVRISPGEDAKLRESWGDSQREKPDAGLRIGFGFSRESSEVHSSYPYVVSDPSDEFGSTKSSLQGDSQGARPTTAPHAKKTVVTVAASRGRPNTSRRGLGVHVRSPNSASPQASRSSREVGRAALSPAHHEKDAFNGSKAGAGLAPAVAGVKSDTSLGGGRLHCVGISSSEPQLVQDPRAETAQAPSPPL